MTTPITPAVKEDIAGDGWWLSLHNRFITEAKEKEPEVLLIGDSIIERLILTEIWEASFAPLHALNFGIAGDTIQNVLWRLQNGELDYLKPKVIVLHVGTNNIENTSSEIAEGIRTITNLISEKQPNAYIIVTSLLPKGQSPNQYRKKNSEVNEILKSTIQTIPKTQFVNIDPGFVSENTGLISHLDMYDYLHLTRQGYKKAFEPVLELLSQLMVE